MGLETSHSVEQGYDGAVVISTDVELSPVLSANVRRPTTPTARRTA